MKIIEKKKEKENYHKNKDTFHSQPYTNKVYDRFLEREPFITIRLLECLNNSKHTHVYFEKYIRFLLKELFQVFRSIFFYKENHKTKKIYN